MNLVQILLRIPPTALAALAEAPREGLHLRPVNPSVVISTKLPLFIFGVWTDLAVLPNPFARREIL
jgi:hypothetical protein